MSRRWVARRLRSGAYAALWLGAAACGGGKEATPQAAAPSAGSELPDPRPRMEVSGLMGTIPERKILGTLEPKLPEFQRCFERGAQQVEFIAGRMDFYFRVGLDGRVEWVYPRNSTVGHRATELCLLAVAEAARFPEPKGGGAAEIRWGFEIDELSDARPPVDWEPERVASALRDGSPALSACRASGLTVTAYVAPGGQVLAAGASAGSREAASQIDCVVEAVQALSMPDPGSYAAKVTFSVP